MIAEWIFVSGGFFVLMLRRPPRSTRTDTLVPYTTHFRSVKGATTKDYVKLVAKEQGWAAVPTGTRKSTYANPEFQKVAKFAESEKKAIDTANLTDRDRKSTR